MRIWLVLLFILSGWHFLGLGVSCEGWYRGKLTWDFSGATLSVDSVFDVKAQWTPSILMESDLYLKDSGFSRLTLRGQWNKSPYQLRSALSFDEDGFDYEDTEWSIEKGPWDVDWEGEINSSGGLNWNIDISYAPEKGVSWEINPHFTDLFSFSSFTGNLSFSIDKDWSGKVSLAINPSDTPVVVPKLRCAGPFLGGSGTIEFTSAKVSGLSYEREQSLDNEYRDLLLEWDSDNGWECSYTYWVSYGDGDEERFSSRARLGPPFAFTDLTWKLSWDNWELTFDFINHEIDFSVFCDLPHDLSLEIDTYWGVGDGFQEIEVYLEGDTFYLDFVASFTEGNLDELELTAKFYF